MSITLILTNGGQLPPSGHYHGIPHIIGDKLANIGGRLSATNKRTNKVSTSLENIPPTQAALTQQLNRQIIKLTVGTWQ